MAETPTLFGSNTTTPVVGTENFGNTFPGASAPFGMVQVSPDTGGQGGYDYKQSSIYGFRPEPRPRCRAMSILDGATRFPSLIDLPTRSLNLATVTSSGSATSPCQTADGLQLMKM